jgi:hypothetical protein
MCIDHGSESQEERRSIVRSWTSIGVELNRETRFPNDIEALYGPVVGVHVAHFNLRTVLV